MNKWNDVDDMVYDLKKRHKREELLLRSGVLSRRAKNTLNDVEKLNYDGTMNYRIFHDMIGLSYDSEDYFKEYIDSIDDFIKKTFESMKRDVSDLQDEWEIAQDFISSKNKFIWFIEGVSDWKTKGKKEKRSFVSEFSHYEKEFIETMKYLPSFYSEYDVDIVENIFSLIKEDVENL